MGIKWRAAEVDEMWVGLEFNPIRFFSLTPRDAPESLSRYLLRGIEEM
jgi:hypothetical protein